MTKKLSLLLAIIMAFCSCIALSSCGETPVEEDGFEYVLDYRISGDGTYYLVTGYGVHGNATVSIPTENEGKPVKEIGQNAFKQQYVQELMEGITIPGSIEKIGLSAFYACTKLTTVNFSEGLKYIDNVAFSRCSALKAINLPEGLEYIGDYAFLGCSEVSSLILPSTLKHIGVSAFAETRYFIHNAPVHNKNVTYIPDTAGKTWVVIADFDIVDANLPDNAVGIASDAFSYCDALTTVEIPAGVKYICANAFEGCTALTTVNYGGSVEDFAKIVIESGNEALTSAQINFGK